MTPRLAPLARAVSVIVVLAAGTACSDEDAATPTTPVTSTAVVEESDDDHANGATTAAPLGITLTVESVAGPPDALVDDLAPFVVHDRHREGIAFAGAGDDDHVFVAGLVDGRPEVFDAAPLFTVAGSVARERQLVALCVDSAYAVVDGAGDKFMARIDLRTRRELATTPLPDGGGPVSCGGGVAVVAGAGLRTLGVDSNHGHQFWELQHELTGEAATAGELTVVPTDAGVLGVDARDGDELWRVEGIATGRPVVGPQGVWLTLGAEYRLLTPDGDVIATFDRAELIGDVEDARGSGLDALQIELAGSAASPVLVVVGTDLLMAADGALRHVAGEVGETVELLGSSDGLVWSLRRRADESTVVELLGADGDVVASADSGEGFVPYVATDQFVVGRGESGLAVVHRG